MIRLVSSKTIGKMVKRMFHLKKKNSSGNILVKSHFSVTMLPLIEAYKVLTT